MGRKDGMTKFLYIGNENALRVEGLYDSVDEAYINNATINVTIKDDKGNPVTGMTWPQAMVYVDGSDGDYTLVLPAELDLSNRKFYKVVMVVVSPKALMELSAMAVIREA